METESTAGLDNPRLRQSGDGGCCVSSDCLDGDDGAGGSVSVDHRVMIRGMDFAVEVRSVTGVPENSDGKRRRGRPPRNLVKAAPVARPAQRVKEEEEDVCFICFDGGSLVLCDRRGCPKAYHPACIKRDESFFRSKAKWNCGWHICSVCQKPSYYMCYTCTYSLCKGCTKGADYVCARGNKGFCGTCMKTIMLIENVAPGNKDGVQVDFDDQTSWEYLFKVYWVLLKKKLSLTVDELMKAKNPWKRATKTCKDQFAELSSVSNGQACVMQTPKGDLAPYNPKRRKIALQLDLLNNKNFIRTDKSDVGIIPSPHDTNWATKELLEFVVHMKNGITSVLSPFDVQTLLLDYITRNNLRDPRQKSQIMCDARLINLFGKARLGHFEMLKLLESHFLNQDSQSAIIRAGVVEAVSSQLDINGSNCRHLVVETDKEHKIHKTADDDKQDKQKSDGSDEYAAIDCHNFKLLFLKRHLIERLLDDPNKLHEKIVGSFVRIRVPGTEQKGDFYRLVQVVGTIKVDLYRVGMKMANIMLEIINMGKNEFVSIDGVSNQEFTEEECSMLHQEMQSGLIKQLTVGEVQQKAMQLQAVRVGDWLDSEISRLNHLRDRASENGRRKEHREYVEKLQLLSSPEERQRRISEVPEVHTDPAKNASHGSEEDGRVMHATKEALGRLAEENEVMCAHDEVHISSDIRRREDGSQPHSRGSSPSVSKNEADKIWLYQDPYGNTQGPFSMMMLQRWSDNGHFPPHLMIWRITEKPDNSVLLTDALRGHFHEQPKSFCNSSLPSRDITNGLSDELMDEHSIVGGEANGGLRKPANVEGNWNLLHNDYSGPSTGNNDLGSQSSAMSTNVISDQVQTRNLVQNWDSLKGDKQMPSPPQVSSSLSSSSFSGKPCEAATHQPTEAQGFEGWDSSLSMVQENLMNVSEEKISVEQEKEGIPDRQSGPVSLANPLETSESPISIGFPNFPSTILHWGKEHLKFQVDINEKPLSSDTPAQESGPCGSTTSSLVGGSLLPEVAGNQGGYSPAPSKASPEEWGSNLLPDSSIKSSELASDHVATPYSVSCPVMLPSPNHPATSAVDWQAIIADPDDFSSLVDESVSDLLAEVEAMEALHGVNQPFPSDAEALDSRKHSTGNSSTTDNRRSDVSVNEFDINVSNIKTSPPPTSWGLASADTAWPTGTVSTSLSFGALQGYEHFYPGGPGQVPTNSHWGAADHGTTHLTSRSSYLGNNAAGNFGFWPGESKHSATRERDFQSRYSSSSRNRPFSNTTNRQSYAGGNGAHSFRTTLPKRQRVCKFYESGHCKKGANCSFWHPNS